MALLPLYDNFYSLVWTLKNEEFLYLKDMKDEEFVEELNYALQDHYVR
jgi:2-polyprenyl-6-methoxyphenol hydroxylase-like FAD-dependent oxidoreductase